MFRSFKGIPYITIFQMVLLSRPSNLSIIAFCSAFIMIIKMPRWWRKESINWRVFSVKKCSKKKWMSVCWIAVLNSPMHKGSKRTKMVCYGPTSFIVIRCDRTRKEPWKTIISSSVISYLNTMIYVPLDWKVKKI